MDSACSARNTRAAGSGARRTLLCLLSLLLFLFQTIPAGACSEGLFCRSSLQAESAQSRNPVRLQADDSKNGEMLPYGAMQSDPTDAGRAVREDTDRMGENDSTVLPMEDADGPDGPGPDEDSDGSAERMQAADGPDAQPPDSREAHGDSSGESMEDMPKEDSSSSPETAGQKLEYEDETVRIHLDGSFSPSCRIFWQGPWSESSGSTRWITFDLSLLEGERITEPMQQTQVDLLLKGVHRQEHETLRLLHRRTPRQSDWVDTDLMQDSDGLRMRFTVPSFSEFVLTLTDGEAGETASAPAVWLYRSDGQLDRQLSLQDGQSVILPLLPSDSSQQSGKFLGWSTSERYIENGEAWKTNPLYAPGSTLIWSEAIKENPYRLYPVWARSGEGTWADFFIRLDGKIPNEPTSNGAGLYTRKIPIFGGLQWVAPYVDSAGIQVGAGGRLAMEPDAEQLQTVINEKAGSIGYGARAIDGVLYKTGIGDPRPVDAANHPVDWSEGDPVPADAVRLSMLWYVIKKEQYNWHVDGVLLESSRYSLIYTIGNAGMGEVSGMPNGIELNPGTTVHAGHSFNNASDPAMVPVRAGYTFLGWQDTASQKTYSSGETFPIERNTVLQALWKPNDGNSFTLTKYDRQTGQTLDNAVFELDSRSLQPEDPWQILQGSLRTQANGTIVYDGLQPDRIYRLKEIQPPFGYRRADDFCFRLENQAGTLTAFLCDENGNEISSPDGFLSVFGDQSIMLSLRVPDTPYLCPFAAEKRAAESGAPLAGARYRIVRIKDGFQTPVAEGTSDSSGRILWNGEPSLILYDGQYSIEETVPPDGCVRNPDPIEMEIRESAIRLLRNSDRAVLRPPSEGDSVSRLILMDEKGTILPETGSLQKLQAQGLSAASALSACLLAVLRQKKHRRRSAGGSN